MLAQIVERWKAYDGDPDDLITEAERSPVQAALASRHTPPPARTRIT